MTSLNPQPPFVWPEPRVIAGMASYQENPPYNALALESQSVFGILSGLTAKGIDVIRNWLAHNSGLKARFVVMPYPACATRQTDFSRLFDLVEQEKERLSIHVRPLEYVTDRAMNTLCFLISEVQAAHVVVVGPTEDMGLAPRQEGHVNFVFRADPALIEGFRRYFNWLWASSRDLIDSGVAQIPALILPEGTEEGARLWRAYRNECGDDALSGDAERLTAHVNSETGDVALCSEDGEEIAPPTDELGLKKLDPLAEFIARVYTKGSLVSIDKLSRIPPLDVPLDPSTFGDSAEIHKGNRLYRK